MTVDEYLNLLKERFKTINPNEYYLSYSGGKDSHLLYWFIKEYAKIDGIEIVGVDTFMEHDEILERIRKNSDVVIKPDLTPFEIKERYGIPCFTKWQDGIIYLYQKGGRSKSVMQAVTRTDVIKFKLNKKASALTQSGALHKVSSKCDLYNKKRPLAQYEKATGRKAIIGVRGDESISRKNLYNHYLTKQGRFVPIYDLSDDMQTAIYERYNIEIPSLYKYLDRTGCMGCPYGLHGGTTAKELALLSEDKRQMVIELFKESYEVLGFDYNNIQPIENYEHFNDPCTCLVCGKLFERGRSSLGMYCSRACQHKSMTITKKQSICIVCGKPFFPTLNSKGLCCSRKCGAIYRHRTLPPVNRLI